MFAEVQPLQAYSNKYILSVLWWLREHNTLRLQKIYANRHNMQQIEGTQHIRVFADDTNAEHGLEVLVVATVCDS